MNTDQRALAAPEQFVLSEQQVRFFQTFGFVALPGLLRDDIEHIEAGFERVFANHDNPRWETYEELHFEQKRLIIPAFLDRDPELAALKSDPRVEGVVGSLLPQGWEYAESDGNIFSCESSWHSDTYGAGLGRAHVKLSVYLDRLDDASGAIRVIPGTNHHRTTFASVVRKAVDRPDEIAAHFGVDARDLPSWTIASVPGDVIVWDFRTIHASFNGGARRRLFSINFREVAGER